MFFNALLALTLRTYLVWENKKFEARDELSQGGAAVDYEQRAVGVENEGFGFRNFL